MTHSYAHIYRLLDPWIIPVSFIHLCCYVNILSRRPDVASFFQTNTRHWPLNVNIQE